MTTKKTKTYMVHVGLRFTTNFEIEATSEDEALEKAELIVENLDSLDDFEFASDDYDIIDSDDCDIIDIE